MDNKLHRITGRARKCGPTALSAVTGKPSHECAAVIRQATGKRAINGVSHEAMLAALNLMNYRTEVMRFDRAEWPILNRWLEDNQNKDGIYIIDSGHHWIAYSAGMLADSGHFFGRKPIAVSEVTRGLKSRVRVVICVNKFHQGSSY